MLHVRSASLGKIILQVRSSWRSDYPAVCLCYMSDQPPARSHYFANQIHSDPRVEVRSSWMSDHISSCRSGCAHHPAQHYRSDHPAVVSEDLVQTNWHHWHLHHTGIWYTCCKSPEYIINRVLVRIHSQLLLNSVPLQLFLIYRQSKADNKILRLLVLCVCVWGGDCSCQVKLTCTGQTGWPAAPDSWYS